MHLFADLPFAIVLMLKRSLFAETDFLCWKPKLARQESKRSYSLLMHSCCGRIDEQSNSQTKFEFWFLK